MTRMNAAVVRSFDEPPHYEQFEVPQPTTDSEMLVESSPSACTRGCVAALMARTTRAPGRCR